VTKKLEGKIALITGGNSGIGLLTAKKFVSEGAYAFITGRREAELTEAAKQIGRNVRGVQGDVSSLGELDRLFAQIKREKGRIDVLFANAGFASLSPVEKITEQHYDSLFNTNVKGLLFTVLKAIPLMPDGSAIILNASIVASKGLPDFSVYSATKAAVRSFARTLTTDLKERRIRVNAVSPGLTDTPAWHASESRRAIDVQRCFACQVWHTRRDREGRAVSRLGRQQLPHGNRMVRGWRLRTGVVGSWQTADKNGEPMVSARQES
jgi:NAD(P)-dependent dehydrogenase (short-subunit alcohol dehydrogenase family)